MTATKVAAVVRINVEALADRLDVLPGPWSPPPAPDLGRLTAPRMIAARRRLARGRPARSRFRNPERR